MDLRQFLLRLEKNGVFVDRTDDVVTVMPMGDKHLVTFADGGRYSYGPDRVDLRAGREEPLVGPCRA